MKSIVRAVLAVVSGIAVAVVLLIAIEAFSEMVHPAAPFHGNVPDQVRHYPDWVLGIVVIAWGGTAAASTWVASRIGRWVAGGVVSVLLAWALVFNLVMLPYAVWFKFAMAITFPIACILGLRYGKWLRSA